MLIFKMPATKRKRRVVKKTSASSKSKTKTKRPATRRTARPQGISSLYPSTKFVTMTFAHSTGLSSGIVQNNFGTSILYNLNSIYNPKTTTPSYRPQGYDQISGIYNQYKVYGVKCQLTVSNVTQDGVWLGARLGQYNATDYLDGEALSSARMKKWTTVKPINNSGKQVIKYTRYFDIKSVEGLTKTQFNGDITLYGATIAANPSRMPFISFAIINTADGTNAQVAYDLVLTYYVQLFDRKSLANSTI